VVLRATKVMNDRRKRREADKMRRDIEQASTESAEQDESPSS
jgi:hypothetical protein